MKLLLILFILLSTISFAQTTSLTGKVHNQKTNQPIPFVNIGVEGTFFGTSSNEYGNFKLVLANGTHNLLVSCVGFETKKINVTLPKDKEITVDLKPIPIELPEVIIDADENPAYAIIRKAIANKEKNKKGLQNYYYDFYSKNILKSGSEIVFVEEDIGEGLIILNEEVREIKTKLHKTENISGKMFQSGDLNFLEKKIIDFTEDSLTLGEFVFHLPLSINAFDYYDYNLLGIKKSDERYFYQIEVIPYSNIRPTFSGEILIDDSSYALTGLNLSLKSRNFLPFTDLEFSVVQNLINYNNYWLPKYYNIDLETNVNYYHLFRLDSAITSFVKVFNNFKINLDLNTSNLQSLMQPIDSLKKNKPELITLSQMDSLRLYPLSRKEENAYKNIDSSKSIVSSLKLGGIGGEYVKEAENKRIKDDTSGVNLLSAFEYLSFRNNRVDGIALGLRYSNFNIDSLFGFSAEANYSFLREDVNAEVIFEYRPDKLLFDKLSFSGFYESKSNFIYSPYSHLWNAVSVSFGFEDQYDYYHSKGVGAYLQKDLSKRSNIKFGLTFENQKSLKANKYYSIFNSTQNLRQNLVTGNGNDNRFIFNFKIRKSPFELDFIKNDGFVSQIDISTKLLGSDFNYTKISAAYQVYTDTFFDELLFSPYLGIFIDASMIFRSYSNQHLISPNTALGLYSPLGTFKGISPYKFVGDKSLAIHLEHNWRKTFFDMLGIYFPVAWNLELTTGASFLKIWNESNYLKEIKSNDYYWEFYAGISGILGVLNVNIAYNKFKNTVVRFGFSKFL